MTIPLNKNRTALLHEVLRTRIAVLDGAMGTMVHALELDEHGFRGERFENHPKDLKNCIDILTLTQGESIKRIHASYLNAALILLKLIHLVPHQLRLC